MKIIFTNEKSDLPLPFCIYLLKKYVLNVNPMTCYDVKVLVSFFF